MQTINGKPTRQRLVCYDVIRIFSCFCVLTCHFNASVSGFNGTFVYPNSILPNFYLGGRLYLGDIGVSLFFILSGATLMLTYRDVKTFYKKRVLNIYPMFWIAYVLAMIYDFLEYKHISPGSPLLLLPSIAGMDGYLCTLGIIGFDFYKVGEWFLGCIVLLYLVFPLLHLGMEKQPVLTAALCLVLYGLCVGKVSSISFFLRIPEMLFGMAVTRYHLEKKPGRLTAIGAGMLLLVWLFRDRIQPLTFNIAACMLLFGLLTWLSEWIRKGNGLLAAAANLTYPAFLVHHWLIAKLVKGFDLASMSRRDVIALFGIYLAATAVLSKGMTACADKVTAAAAKRKAPAA